MKGFILQPAKKDTKQTSSKPKDKPSSGGGKAKKKVYCLFFFFFFSTITCSFKPMMCEWTSL